MKLLFLFAALFLTPCNIYAKFQIPDIQDPVVDLAKVLSDGEKGELSALLWQAWEDNVAQIAILTIPSLNDQSIEELSIRVVEKWKLGHSKNDNGILIVVAAEDKAVRIEVGQGLEGAIPDIYAKRIITNIIGPEFKNKRYGDGLKNASRKLIQYASSELNSASNQKEKLRSDSYTARPASSVFSTKVEAMLPIIAGIHYLILFFPLIVAALVVVFVIGMILYKLTRNALGYPENFEKNAIVSFIEDYFNEMEKAGRSSRPATRSQSSSSSSDSSSSDSSSSRSYEGGGGSFSGGGASGSW